MKRAEQDAPLPEALSARVRSLPRDIAPPPDLWPGIAARIAQAPPTPVSTVPAPSRDWGLGRGRAPFTAPLSRWGVRPALAAGLVLVVGGVLWPRLSGTPRWRVAQASGTYVFSSGRLETATAARVRLDVGRIGEVDVAPQTRIRLLSSRPGHRLALDEGSIEARISAPPRLFYVETPSATAVDLGCAYTLAVDPRGGSFLHVTVGWVELQRRGRTSIVPFNMAAYTRPGFAPGTPFSDRAADTLKAALYRFDFESGGATALAAVLAEAREPDAITLWHLLARSEGALRASVYGRLAELVPPPAGVTRSGVLRLERSQLEQWWDALPGSPGTPSWFERLAARLAAWTGGL
jgi:hypothetical protein